MKKLPVILIFVFLARISAAQKEQLSFDEHDKYIYYQVVDMPGLTGDTLAARELHFLKTAYPKARIKTILNSNQITAEGKFLVYDGTALLRHESGQIVYMLTVESKDQKYRYWITGFIYTPWKRDRYGNFVPERGIEVPLEKISSKLDKKEAAICLNQTDDFCREFGEKLKFSLAEARAPKKSAITKKTITDNW